jgi:phenylalanyl-tRNA synthetase beta chain
VPSYRNDLQLHQDLTEEVARIYGYERIPTSMPLAELREVVEPPGWGLAERARDALAGAGLLECVCLPFLSREELQGLRLEPEDERNAALRVLNPISDEEPLLRTTLLPSLLRLVRQNRNRQVDRVRLFELSRVFRPGAGEGLPDEPPCAAAVLTAGEERQLWETPAPLFFQAKGVVERLLFQLGYVAWLRREAAAPNLHPGAAAAIEVGGRGVGMVGELHPAVAAAYGIDVPCAAIEIDLGALEVLPRRDPRYRDIPRQPRVRRDIAVILDRDQLAGEVQTAIRETAGADLVSVHLFDRYEGEGVPEGRVSLAFRLEFQKPNRALTDAEVAGATDRVVQMLSDRFGGELR